MELGLTCSFACLPHEKESRKYTFAFLLHLCPNSCPPARRRPANRCAVLFCASCSCWTPAGAPSSAGASWAHCWRRQFLPPPLPESARPQLRAASLMPRPRFLGRPYQGRSPCQPLKAALAAAAAAVVAVVGIVAAARPHSQCWGQEECWGRLLPPSYPPLFPLPPPSPALLLPHRPPRYYLASPARLCPMTSPGWLRIWLGLGCCCRGPGIRESWRQGLALSHLRSTPLPHR